jgi:hypothetical protein
LGRRACTNERRPFVPCPERPPAIQSRS